MSIVRTCVVALLVSVGVAVAQPESSPRKGQEARGPRGAGGRPVGVSPGGAEGFTPAASACPTFTWAEVAGASGYALEVFRVGDLELARAEPALAVELPAGASAWTPPGDGCLTAGERYAWSVRAVVENGSGPWSEALLFEIADAPTADELQRALEVVQRYLGTARVGEQLLGEAVADTALTRPVAAAQSPRTPDEGNEAREVPIGGGPAIALRGEVPDVAGETYGVRGVSNSPDGAGVRADNNNGSGVDLVLGGTPVAEVTEASFARESASNLTFNFTNPGAGTLTLQVDGSSVVTGATDDWVNETGDAMTGLLSIDVPSGFALQTAAGDSIDVGGDFFKSGGRILHTSGGINNLGVGPAALAAVTTGSLNTAVGDGALVNNTTGSYNVALGRKALAANTTAYFNTAVGSFALDVNTTGSRNVALGSGALTANTTADDNVAVGNNALGANMTGDRNVAIGTSALGSVQVGNSNVAIGLQALGNTFTASYNTAIGTAALFYASSGSSNVAIGHRALRNSSSGAFNVALGRDALYANTTASNNTALGGHALDANTTGADNVALGRDALGANTTAHSNTAVGTFALDANTTGTNNVAVGRDALGTNVGASSNTAVGTSALEDNTVGANHVALGASALANNTFGQSNTALGASALAANTNGSYNVAVGREALMSATGGFSNTALGVRALQANTTGTDNVAVGRNALAANTGAIKNVAVGAYALDSSTLGNQNVAIGWQAMDATTIADNNTAVGYRALRLNTTGYTNVAVGAFAMSNNTTGQGNVAIGPTAGNLWTTGSNNIAIGAAQGIGGESNTMRLGFAQTATFISGIRGATIGANGVNVLIDSGGQLGTIASSARFKEDIVDLGEASERLLALRPVQFRYTPEVQAGERPIEYGLIAEEVAEVFPELVVYDAEGRPETVKYHVLSTLLLNELQRERERGRARDERLQRLEAQMAGGTDRAP